MQTAIGRHQETIDRLVAAFGVNCFKLFESHRLGKLEGTGMRTTQFGNIGATTEDLADIFDQRADVGALGATH
ncbi:hypothetical protein D3C77_633060 [compost metagenome]